MKKQLLLLISGIMLFSCANEDDNIKKHSTSVESSSPIPIVGSFKELYELSGIKFEEPIQQSSDDIIPYKLQDYTAIGYTRITESRYMITMFEPVFADAIGLVPYTTYVYNWLFVEKDINTNGARFYRGKTSPKCGMTPVMSDDYQEITEFLNRGYRSLDEGNPTILRTHIFYVLSIYNGAQLNKYVPCLPEDLQWNYYLLTND